MLVDDDDRGANFDEAKKFGGDRRWQVDAAVATRVLILAGAKLVFAAPSGVVETDATVEWHPIIDPDATATARLKVGAFDLRRDLIGACWGCPSSAGSARDDSGFE